MSFKQLHTLKSQLNCDVSSCNNDQPCYICPLAEHKRLPFVYHNQLSKSPFDLIHCDVWGSYHVTVVCGYRYFLTIVDDCTRFTWIYLLKQKYDVVVAIPQFFNMISTQFNNKIKCFRYDNAPELAFTDFFNERGVLHQYSCVAIPEKNSVVERKHQHLLNVARALFFFSPGFLFNFGQNVSQLLVCYILDQSYSFSFVGKQDSLGAPIQHYSGLFLPESVWLLNFCFYFSKSSYQISAKSQNLCLCWIS